ncbi:thioredoxin-dependent thiol peroxidase [Leucobacter sp. HY1910]
MSERVILEAGQPAPEFALPDQDGVTRSLSDYLGETVVLFFYPAAMTPGCTKEACDFRDAEAALQAAGVRVLGISRDKIEKQRKFADRDELGYPLLSDVELDVHRAYGAFGTKNSYGRIIEGVIRSTFVIDADGNVAHALYNVKATGHVARVRKLLGLDA